MSIVEIICKKHGIFKQPASTHLFGYGCSQCGGSKTLTLFEFIKKANKTHNNKYDYSLSEYINNKTKLLIICKTHGSFLQNAKNHMNGSGCPKCKQPKNEQKTGTFLKEILPNVPIHPHKEFTAKGLNSLEKIIVDYYFELGDRKYIVEYNGIQHYQPIRFGNIKKETSEKVFAYQQKRDQFLRELCKKEDISLIEIDGRKIVGPKIKQFLVGIFQS